MPTDKKDPAFLPGRFSELDAGETDQYVSYLEQTGSRLRELSRARYALLELHPGDKVLDLGCGLGEAARDFAELVGGRGRVVGVDFSAGMVSEARNRSRRDAIEFAVGDAHRLQFAGGSFDACWSERVLQHLAEPAVAVAEMVRVIRPGGRLVVFEPDHNTLVIDAADRAATAVVVRSLAGSIRSSWAGRALFGLLKTAGLDDVRVVPTPIVSHSLADTNALLRLDAAAQAAVARGELGEQQAARWFEDLKERDRARLFFGCLLCFAAAGRKPAR